MTSDASLTNSGTTEAPLRIAVGTSNGVSITEHFGFATEFQIWDVAGAAPRLVETRQNVPACGAKRRTNSVDLMQGSVDAVADCRAVVVARIGECALTRLLALGILAFEANDTVETALREIALHPSVLAGPQA
jgi:nitrogen fixation protein NifB